MLKLLLQMFAEGEDNTNPNADPAQTNDQSTAGDGQEHQEGNQQGDDKTPEQIEAERVETEKAAEAKRLADEKKAEDEKARNAEEARKRREREKQEAIDKARLDAIKDLYDVNPYTNEPIESEDDIEEFKIMRKIEKDGGDPITDYHKYLKKYNKEKAQQIEERTKAEEHTQKDIEAFRTAHPEVQLNDVLKDEDFAIFSEGKIGNVPLTKIYEDFQKFVGKYKSDTDKAKEEAEKKAKEEAARKLAQQQATPGSLGGGAAPKELYTLDQIDKMSVKEVKANLEKVNKSIEYYNKNKN